jgi:hypothetical protein
VTHGEIVYNRRAENGETSVYIPTMPGWGTGEAFAIIALLTNENQTGHILMLAGSNSVATAAATGWPQTWIPLRGCFGNMVSMCMIPKGQFEFLLRVNTMASSLNTFQVAACHRLFEFAH